MKNVLFVFFGLVLLAGCEKEQSSPAEVTTQQEIDLRSAGDCGDCAKAYWILHKTANGAYIVLCIDAEGWDGDPDDPEDMGHSGHADDIRLDADGDGFTAPNPSGCGSQTDCDDANADVHPGATEIPYDGVDNDCNPATPDDDLDGDGFNLADDCNDEDPTVHEVTTYYVDTDGDGYGSETTADLCAASAPGGYSDQSGDCDDNNGTINPGVEEVCGDGIDNDCDGKVDEDCTVPLEICDRYAGGIVFYLAETPTDLDGNGTLDQGLVVANVDQGATQWPYASNLIADVNNYDAAGQAYQDWFLPSIEQLNLIWENLVDLDGDNYNSGPEDENNCGGIPVGRYWSSTESSYGTVWTLYFLYGGQRADVDANVRYVRAVRAF